MTDDMDAVRSTAIFKNQFSIFIKFSRISFQINAVIAAILNVETCDLLVNCKLEIGNCRVAHGVVEERSYLAVKSNREVRWSVRK